VLEYDTEVEPGLGLDVALLLGDGETPVSGVIGWGDNTTTTITGGGIYTHTWPAPGRYTVRVSVVEESLGSFGGGALASGYALSQRKLVAVSAFGENMGITGLGGAFWGCRNLISVPNYLPVSRDGAGNVIKRVTTLADCFRDCAKFDAPIGLWDVSAVQSFRNTFLNCAIFNRDLSQWDMSSASDCAAMFRGCLLFNSPLNAWGELLGPSLSDTTSMFFGCVNFNQPLNLWAPAMASVGSLTFMFSGCSRFDGDIENWRLSTALSVAGILNGCENFRKDLSGWDMSFVRDATDMLRGCRQFNSDLSGWDVSNLITADGMFRNCTGFQGAGLSAWVTSSLTSARFMFQNAFAPSATSAFNGDLTGDADFADSAQNSPASTITNRMAGASDTATGTTFTGGTDTTGEIILMIAVETA